VRHLGRRCLAQSAKVESARWRQSRAVTTGQGGAVTTENRVDEQSWGRSQPSTILSSALKKKKNQKKKKKRKKKKRGKTVQPQYTPPHRRHREMWSGAATKRAASTAASGSHRTDHQPLRKRSSRFDAGRGLAPGCGSGRAGPLPAKGPGPASQPDIPQPAGHILPAEPLLTREVPRVGGFYQPGCRGTRKGGGEQRAGLIPYVWAKRTPRARSSLISRAASKLLRNSGYGASGSRDRGPGGGECLATNARLASEHSRRDQQANRCRRHRMWNSSTTNSAVCTKSWPKPSHR